MYNIGYVDDETLEYDNYKVDLAYYDINLINIDNIKTKSDLKNFILDLKLDCLIIDYNLNKLKQKDLQDGNELVRFINIEVPDFPCIILTSYPGASREEKTVVNSFILDRDDLTKDTDGGEYKKLVDKIINSIEVYKKRLELNKVEYEQLIRKRAQSKFSIEDEDRIITLYKILFAYGIVDEINPELLRKNIEVKMDVVISKLKKILGE